jgi:nucleoside diphosphate kinase
MKMQMVSKAHAEKHYADLAARPFFGSLVEYSAQSSQSQPSEQS